MTQIDEHQCLTGAREALYRWANAVQTRDVAHVMALYAADAILVPTLSNDVRDCPSSRRAYFETFLDNEGMRCEIVTFAKRVSRKLGTVVVGGLYRFWIVRNGIEQQVPARFLFTFEQIDGQWLITGHHSSTEI